MEKQLCFTTDIVLDNLKHFLPAQAALKDFVHHNTLHSLQKHDFFTALQMGHEIFGYQTTLRLDEYRDLYRQGAISENIIDSVIQNADCPIIKTEDRKKLMFSEKSNDVYNLPKVGQIRHLWKDKFGFDIETVVNHTLFKIVASYLDQGISAVEFRSASKGFLSAIQTIHNNSYFPVFKSKRIQEMMSSGTISIRSLLDILIGDERYYEQYLFDQQFSHPGWSGFVAVCESNPDMLFDKRTITLSDFITFELLLEIDALDNKIGLSNWEPLAKHIESDPIDLFERPTQDSHWYIKQWWQESLENSYFDQVLSGLHKVNNSLTKVNNERAKFQAFFCIDDREESLRRWIEYVEPNGVTYGTPAHFNLLIKYKPKGGKFNAHVCPGPASPKHIIVDEASSESVGRDLHFHQSSNGLLTGWIISQTLGLWSAVKLFVNLFKPSISPGHSSAFEHMSHKAQPQYENMNGASVDGFQLGFTVSEMIEIVTDELSRTGLIENFAPIVYFVGHGGSSTNNPYFAGYNCGACSGRPSSLNSRVLAKMANRTDVRLGLKNQGIDIPNDTQFVGGLHDTTKDEMTFYDIELLNKSNLSLHKSNIESFNKAMEFNAKERSRQFLNINTNRPADQVHKDVALRAFSLFEPRPELNHSNNCLCIVGRRQLSKSLFLDQRSFLNSYNYEIDKDGRHLTKILGAATPVCGGINLEYYFSRVDNERFGAGSKLPHNVVGLYGVANGVEGDLRTGLPSQMIDVHVPLRLMMIVEQECHVVLHVLNNNPATKEWYDKGWLKLSVICPVNKKVYVYRKASFDEYNPISGKIKEITSQEEIAETLISNSPVFKIA